MTKPDNGSMAMVEPPTVITPAGGIIGFDGLKTTPPALEVESLPGSAATGEIDGETFAGSTTTREEDRDGFAGSTMTRELDVPGSTATDDIDVDGSTATGSLLDAGGISAAVGAVVGLNVEVVVGAVTSSVVEPGEAGSVVLMTGAVLVMGSAVGVVVVKEKALSLPSAAEITYGGS